VAATVLHAIGCVLQIGFCSDSGFGPILREEQTHLAGKNMENSQATKGPSIAPNEFVIRPASVKEAAAILQCLRDAFEPYRSQYSPQAWLDTVMTPDALLHRLTSMTVLVAVSMHGNVVGTIGGAVVSTSEGHLRGMAVSPQWHGRGIAQRLLEAMEKHLLAKGCTRISLDTTEPLRRAMHFYEKNGFTRTGKITDFFGMPLIEYAKFFPQS
jgi:ribosomal protein S18 acetylase RimI-like enzyme